MEFLFITTLYVFLVCMTQDVLNLLPTLAYMAAQTLIPDCHFTIQAITQQAIKKIYFMCFNLFLAILATWLCWLL